MKKMSYKHVVFFLTIISVILLVIVKNEPTDTYIKTIIISLSINVISSIVIIFMIDIKKENDAKRHIEERRKIIYKSLILPIREYNSLIYNLYKATTKKEKINLKCFNNNIDIDKIFKNIKLLDVYKEGYIYDIYKKQNMLWKDIIINEYLAYIKSLKEFYNINSQFIDNELSELIFKIISYEKMNNICNLMLHSILKTDIDNLIQLLDLKEIYLTTNKIESIIENYISIDCLKAEQSTLMADNVSPRFGSGIRNK